MKLVFRVLYLFAGPKRRADFSGVLQAMLREWALVDPWWAGVEVQVEEVDILRDKERGNLLHAASQEKWLSEIDNGDFDLLITTPPCGGFSRLLFAGRPGPKALRNREHPRGFPWLRGNRKAKVDEQNSFFDFSIAALRSAIKGRHGGGRRRCRVLLEHPEDYGSAYLGEPASIWQLDASRDLLTLGGREWVHGDHRGLQAM